LSTGFQAQIFAPKSILLGFYRYQSKAELKSRSTISLLSFSFSWMKHLIENTDVCCRNIFIAGLQKFSILHPFKLRSVLPILKYPLWGPNDWW
jgi:hypothetical protein